MITPEQALASKRDFLVPCVYHFYQRPPVICRGEGAYLYDTTGKRYLDCFAGVTVMNAGHSNAAIIEPAIDQLRQLQHTTSVYLTEPVLKLARRIAELAPAGIRRSFFCASGSEANEGAFMLATLATGRREFVSLDSALHGRTKAAINANGLEMWRADPFPLADFHRVPGPRHPDSLGMLESLLRKKTVAAVIAEPVQGNGGIVVPPNDYWRELRNLCTRYGSLLIADEVQTAWNRTGHWFATQHWGIVPDVITVAKALGNGFPIAAYLTTDELASKFTRPAAATFGGNLVSCQAALATLQFHESFQLGQRSRDLGQHLLTRLKQMQSRQTGIADVRGLGLMIGMELAGDDAAVQTETLLEWMKDAGYLIGKCGPGRNVLAFLPPLVVQQHELDLMADALEHAYVQL